MRTIDFPPQVATTYVCPTCRVESPVTVDIAEPAAIEGAPRPTLDRLAQDQLRFATCPRCQQRNPVGIELLRAEGRSGRLLSLGLLVAIAIPAWFYPLFALGAPALSILFTAFGVHARRRAGLPLRWRGVMMAVITPLALAGAIVMYPRYAVLAPMLLIGPALFLPSRGDEQRWKETAESLRFVA